MDVAKQQEDLSRLVGEIIQVARDNGADAAEVAVNDVAGLTVTARVKEVETVEHTRDRGFGITVYIGARKGSASTSDSSPDSVQATVQAACDMARFASEDPCAGLADPERMAQSLPDLDLYHPWGIDADAAIELALECEAAGMERDARIQNSEGASVSSHAGVRVYGNSHGFVGAYPYSRHSVSCALIASAGEEMQRDHWYSVARESQLLEKATSIGHRAAERAVGRLGAREIKTGQYPVVFAAEVARGLISNFFAAISGGNLYRKSSFLLDSLGTRVFPDHVSIREEPLQRGGMSSAAFDDEGVATASKDIVADGIVQSYLLGSYSARKLGMETTANAGGTRNVYVRPGEMNQQALLREMGTGLLVTELMGFGVNIVTGDYSRGCAGFWVEDGEISHPVEEITIAENLRDMFAGMRAVGNDLDERGNIHCGSILLDRMTVAAG